VRYIVAATPLLFHLAKILGQSDAEAYGLTRFLSPSTPTVTLRQVAGQPRPPYLPEIEKAESGATLLKNNRFCPCEPCASAKYQLGIKNYKDHHNKLHKQCTVDSCLYLQEQQALGLMSH